MKKWIKTQNRWCIASVDKDTHETDIIYISDEKYQFLLDQISKGGYEIIVNEDGTDLILEKLEVPSDDFMQQQQINIDSLSALASSDWKVIRELERKFLLGTELNSEREELRNSVIRNI